MQNLVEQAQAFAQDMQDLVNSTICSDFSLETISISENAVQILSKPSGGTMSAKSISLPIETSPLVNDEPVLGLKLAYTVEADPKSSYLRVRNSAAAITMIQENERPVIRLEFERDKGIEPGEISKRAHGRHAAHFQIHGVSADLSYIWGLTGRHTKRNLESLHIPVGGRRFRPTMEDLIEFLYLEKIVLGLKDGGQSALEAGRKKWFSIQLASTIRSNQLEAIKILETEGFRISKLN
jgi:hypothetical protein